MSKLMPRTARAIMLVAVIILILATLSFQSVFAESETRANSATSFAGANFTNRLTGDSYVTGLGSHAKITLYLATTNDPAEISLNMGNVAATRKDGEKMFVKFGESIFVKADKGTNIPTSAYINKSTNKYDTLVDFKKGEKKAPVYNSSTKIAPNDMVSQLDIPKWLKDDASTTNQKEVVSWMNNTSGNFVNLYDLVIQVAEKADPAKASGLNAVGNVLNSTLKNSSFKYTNAGQLLTLSKYNVMPGENYAYWLVVYEPLIYYSQDPNKMFYPSKDAGDYLFTATDAVLVNAKAGTAGYPPAKFAAGTPGIDLHSNHCNLCDKTWYGYPEWNPKIPFAYYCPLPCMGVSKDFDGVKITKRYPFAIPSAIVLAARTFTVKEDWMKYSGGYLVDKPVGGIDSLIDSASDVDNILHYGGYSVFVNGPTETSPTLYARAVVLDKEYQFVEIPGTEIKMSIKNDPQNILSVKTPTSGYIGMGKIPNINVQDLVPQAVSKPVNSEEILTERLFIKESSNFLIPLTTAELEDFKKEIESAIGKGIQMDDIVLFDGDTLAAYINLDVLYNSTDELDWKNVEIVLAQKYVYNMQDATDYGAIYNPETKKWSASKGFDWTAGTDAFLTVIIPAVVKNDVIETPIAPSSNTIAENELIKAMSGNVMSVVSLQKTCTDTACSGTKQETYTYTETDPKTGKKVTKTGSRTVNCGHSSTLSNAKNITPTTLSVQPGWYWTNAMFNGISKLSVLRGTTLTNDGVNFAFNQTSTFTSNNMSNVFDALTDYKFLTHRSADPANNGAVKPLQLAGYMNNTNQNKEFQTFITPYYGTYPSVYSNPTGDFGGRDLELITSLPLPSSVTAIGSGNYCSGGSSNNLSIPSKLFRSIQLGGTNYSDTIFKTQTNITIKPTVASVDKEANDFATNKLYNGIDPAGAGNPQYHIQVQSDSIIFNPAFKMKYMTSNAGGGYKDVWVLAKGQKTFTSDDYVKIELTKTNLSITSPWSRDKEDKVDETGKIKTVPTAKAGSTIKASANGSTVQVDVIYHIQDPNFVDPSQKANVQSKNDLKATQFDNMVISIADQFKANGVSFYSNMYQSTTAETQNKLPSPNTFRDLTSKTILKLAGSVKTNVGVRTKAYYLDLNGVADYTTNARAVTINGKSVPANTKWTDVSAVRSTKVLNDLLVKNYGVDIAGWYNEDYEGIIVVHKTYIITLSGLESTYAQIHPQHSDVLTERNKLAKPLKFVGGSETLIQDHFGIGVEYRLPTLNINGQSFENIVLPSKPFVFDIRGSIYDTK